MATIKDQLAEQAEQIADLQQEITELREQAFTIRRLGELMLERREHRSTGLALASRDLRLVRDGAS